VVFAHKKGHTTAIGDMTFLFRLIHEIEWVKSPRAQWAPGPKLWWSTLVFVVSAGDLNGWNGLISGHRLAGALGEEA
jgi:hypothetical protein